jgi:hypothetical protein
MSKAKIEEMIGRRFGKVTVISKCDDPQIRKDRQNPYFPYWTCRCDCGRILRRRTDNLKHNASCASCGAGPKPTHGHAGRYRGGRSPEYRVWSGMIQRCHNPNHDKHRIYGARGICVCERWRRSFVAFLEDVGPRPHKGLQLDRINNDGNYEPGNVRWTTPMANCRNSRNAKPVKAFGRERCMAEWCAEFNMVHGTVTARIKRGWTPERALTTPTRIAA